MTSEPEVFAATQAATEKAVDGLTEMLADGQAQLRQLILNAVAMALIPMVTEVNRLTRELDDAKRYIAELEREDEPQPRRVTYVDAGGQRLAHGGHHDDDDAIRMAQHWWQLAVEDGEIGAVCLAAIEAGEVVVTRETDEPTTEDDDAEDDPDDGPTS